MTATADNAPNMVRCQVSLENMSNSVSERNVGLSWAAVGVIIALELLIGLIGWAAGYFLLNINLVKIISATFTIGNVLLGSAAGLFAALAIWTSVIVFRPLRKSKSLRILNFLRNGSWLQLISLCLAAGVAEEVFFRGFLQTLIGLLPAAVIFGVAHAYGRLYIAVALLAGLGLGYLYIYSGSLAAVIATHTVYNLAVMSLLKLRCFPIEHDQTESAPETREIS